MSETSEAEWHPWPNRDSVPEYSLIEPPEGFTDTGEVAEYTLSWFALYPLDQINRSLIERFMDVRAKQGEEYRD